MDTMSWRRAGQNGDRPNDQRGSRLLPLGAPMFERSFEHNSGRSKRQGYAMARRVGKFIISLAYRESIYHQLGHLSQESMWLRVVIIAVCKKGHNVVLSTAKGLSSTVRAIRYNRLQSFSDLFVTSELPPVGATQLMY